jgi:hypothetical protein
LRCAILLCQMGVVSMYAAPWRAGSICNAMVWYDGFSVSDCSQRVRTSLRKELVPRFCLLTDVLVGDLDKHRSYPLYCGRGGRMTTGKPYVCRHCFDYECGDGVFCDTYGRAVSVRGVCNCGPSERYREQIAATCEICEYFSCYAED